jgi:hypothetical protein
MCSDYEWGWSRARKRTIPEEDRNFFYKEEMWDLKKNLGSHLHSIKGDVWGFERLRNLSPFLPLSSFSLNHERQLSPYFLLSPSLHTLHLSLISLSDDQALRKR